MTHAERTMKVAKGVQPLLLVVLAVTVGLWQVTSAVAQQSVFNIETLSTPPQLVSGGDVLVKIQVNQGVPLSKVTIRLNGQNVTQSFLPDAATSSLTGLVTGLTLGQNQLRVSATGVSAQQLTLTNYPITGPITSGPYQDPFICQTQVFALPDGTMFGPSTDANCSAPNKITYIYWPVGGTAFV